MNLECGAFILSQFEFKNWIHVLELELKMLSLQMWYDDDVTY